MELRFFVPMEKPPTTTYQNKGVAYSRKKKRAYMYEREETAEARADLEAVMAGHVPAAPLQGPVYLGVVWCFPDPDHKHRDGEWRTSRPDTDNLEKMLKDVMTKLGYWKDDAQVAWEDIQKRWTWQIPGIAFLIRELEGE